MKKKSVDLYCILIISHIVIMLGMEGLVNKEFHNSRWFIHSYGKQAIIDSLFLIMLGILLLAYYFKRNWRGAIKLFKNKHPSNLSFVIYLAILYYRSFYDKISLLLELLFLAINMLLFFIYHFNIIKTEKKFK